MEYFAQQLINGITLGSIYGLIAIGYTMVFGIIGMVNFAHGDVFMLSTFIALIFLMALTQILGLGSLAVALFIVLILGMLLTSLWSWVIERLAYRPLRNAPTLATLIAAIGMSFILQNVGQAIIGPSPRSVPQLLSNKALFQIGGVSFALNELFVAAITIPLLVGLTWFVQKTRQGKAMRATAQDRDAAAMMGIDIDRTISRTFIIGGALAGAAGFLFGSAFVFSNTMGFIPGIKAFAAAVLGGIGNIRGAMIGGLLLGVAENLIPTAPWSGTAWIGIQWTDVVAFVILILILVFRPTGILGERLGRAA